MKRKTKYEDSLIERLKDPFEAMSFLEIALEEYRKDGDINSLGLSLKYLIKAMN